MNCGTVVQAADPGLAAPCSCLRLHRWVAARRPCITGPGGAADGYTAVWQVRPLPPHPVPQAMQPAQFMRRRQLRAPQEQGTGGWSGWKGNCGEQATRMGSPFRTSLAHHSQAQHHDEPTNPAERRSKSLKLPATAPRLLTMLHCTTGAVAPCSRSTAPRPPRSRAW